MGRPRKHNRDLPQRCYRRHGAIYYVSADGKWTHLGRDMETALATYARIINTPRGGMDAVLDRMIEDAKAKGIAPTTLRTYRGCAEKLKTIMLEFSPEQVRPKHIAQILDSMRDRPAMANQYRVVLKLAFDGAVRAGLVDTNPVAAIGRLRERRRDRYITDAERDAIKAQSPDHLQDIIDLCYLTAQRIGDVLRIELGHLVEGGIVFRQQKTGARLCVAWSPGLRAVVARAKSRLPVRKIAVIGRPQYLLAQRNGRIRGYQGVLDAWRRACTRAGVDDAHLHDLRAKSLTDADRAGLDAKRLAGHTSEAMTRRYLRDRTPTLVQGLG